MPSLESWLPFPLKRCTQGAFLWLLLGFLTLPLVLKLRRQQLRTKRSVERQNSVNSWELSKSSQEPLLGRTACSGRQALRMWMQLLSLPLRFRPMKLAFSVPATPLGQCITAVLAHTVPGIFPSLARMGIQESLTCEAWVRRTPKNVEIRTLAKGHPSELG